MTRLTDKKAIWIALNLAWDTEQSLCEAYGNDQTEEAVQHAQRRMEAFDRVGQRYYGATPSGRPMDRFPKGKPVSIFELFKQPYPTIADSETAKVTKKE